MLILGKLNTSLHLFPIHCGKICFLPIDKNVNENFFEMSMKEIAYNLGFYDEYHFSRQFKKIMRISPTEYKKILKKDDKFSQ